jgi:1-acyl-sn-glycerol-3-phosphate acyltransferase
VSRSTGRPARYLLHSPLRTAARALLRARWEFSVVPGGFPASGPVIVAANHIGVIDGPLLAIMSPRPVHALTKAEMFSGAAGVFFRESGQIRLDRFHADRAAIRSSLAALSAGDAVGIFPEGTRGGGELASIHRGAAYLGMVSGAPIVPLAFFGTREAGRGSSSLPPRGSRIDMVFGEPLVLDQVKWPRTRENVRIATERVHTHLLAHLAATQAATGLTLPGPLPASEDER